jgi:uncharacterized protein YcbK (DUF882 family)
MGIGVPASLPAKEVLTDRYFLSGDGSVRLRNAKSGASARVHYRRADGSYPREARRRVDRLFGVPAGSDDQIALRLVSLLDYIEDRYRREIVIVSGYRSRAYNQSIRDRGGLAARASLHTEGMAADIKLGTGLAPRALEDIKALECCGVGYYHGASVHVDTGPARFWDETSSKVDTDISAHNKRIMVRTDRDIYLSGERVELRVARITDYPIGLVPAIVVVRDGARLRSFPLDGTAVECRSVPDPRSRTVPWKIPEGFHPEGTVQIQLDFCAKPFPEMPDRILSNSIVIRSPE